MNVLIAEDSVLLRERLAKLLVEIPGIGVVNQAGNVRDALAAVRSLEPDLVLLDIQMPDGSGISVLQEIKLRNSTTIVIVFTNLADQQYRQRCAALGAEYFFCKSTDAQLLIEVVEELARKDPQA